MKIGLNRKKVTIDRITGGPSANRMDNQLSRTVAKIEGIERIHQTVAAAEETTRETYMA